MMLGLSQVFLDLLKVEAGRILGCSAEKVLIDYKKYVTDDNNQYSSFFQDGQTVIDVVANNKLCFLLNFAVCYDDGSYLANTKDDQLSGNYGCLQFYSKNRTGYTYVHHKSQVPLFFDQLKVPDLGNGYYYVINYLEFRTI